MREPIKLKFLEFTDIDQGKQLINTEHIVVVRVVAKQVHIYLTNGTYLTVGDSYEKIRGVLGLMNSKPEVKK